MIVRTALLSFLLLTAATPAEAVKETDFGRTKEGREAHLYTLSNGKGMRVSFTDLGGVITAIEVPDRNGKRANVVLGFSNAAEYQAKNDNYFFGVPVGRFANRIKGARFALDGHTYQLTPNNGPNLLHGGPPFYHQRFWAVSTFARGNSVKLSLVSPDGDQGFPGEVRLSMTYTLTSRNELRIDYRATSSKPTVVNFTNHSYFNLAGEGSGDVGGQVIQIMGDRIAELDDQAVPTGRILLVSGDYDLRQPRMIGDGLAALKAKGVGGYDNPWVFGEAPRRKPVLVARATDHASGRMMEVLTTEPSMQFYTANSEWGTDAGPSGTIYRRHGGFALETQHLPDSPNQPAFPTTTLRPGQVFKSTTIYRFPRRP
ncbi:aldose epimerase family protein [uncultured Sphingomonas sp.]|uniref:aldose epimerase family protein n=1 Tax=uncultured Sphingomonas sp. TaxID=158754 RepID=UPI0025E89CC4|nr:aldose epimerase family protein [uncultured Sphingomonas sp.]